MNKKYFMSLFTIVMVTFMSVSFVSCNKSDDDPIGDGGDSRIIGTWYQDLGVATAAWKFENNGKCYYTEWGYKASENWSHADAGTWKVSGNKITTLFIYEDDDYDEYTYVYSISEDGKTLVLSEGDYGRKGTYSKKDN